MIDEARLETNGIVGLYQGEITRARRYFDKWEKRAKRIVKRYRDDRDDLTRDDARFNVLWSNVQTTIPALYARPPKPVVQRRYLDRDPVGRLAAQIMQRVLAYQIDDGDIHEALRLAVEDRLVVGRGVVWVRYAPTFEAVLEPDPITGIPMPSEKLVAEKVAIDYVPWGDFLHSPARVWEEVTWVARKAHMSKAALAKRFGEEIAEKVPLHKPDGMPEEAGYKEMDRACVWEIWDKEQKRVAWIADGYPEPLDVKPPILDLSGFFPCPRPIYATVTTDSLVPVPDYQMYAAQAVEMDELSERIQKITRSVRVTGVYNDSVPDIGRMFTESGDNALFPVEPAAWGSLAAAGGMAGAMQFLPIEQSVKALRELYEARNAVKNDIYEITGISDIIRGQSEASETATAQQIKGQWASMRIRDSQTDVARLSRDILRIMAEIIGEQFDPATIRESSGADEILPQPNPQNPMEREQIFAQAIAVLRSDRQRGFRIDVETDSTVQLDEQAEKQSRVELLTAVGQFLTQALPVVQSYPQVAPFVGQMLLFGMRGFRASPELERYAEDALTTLGGVDLNQVPNQAQNEQEAIVAREKARSDAEIRKIEAQSQADMQKIRAQTGSRITELSARAQLAPFPIR